MDDLDLKGKKSIDRKLSPDASRTFVKSFQLLARLLQEAARENLAFYKVCWMWHQSGGA